MNKKLELSGIVSIQNKPDHFSFFDVSHEERVSIFKSFTEKFIAKFDQSDLTEENFKNTKFIEKVVLTENKIFADMVRNGEIELKHLCALTLNNIKVDLRAYSKIVNEFNKAELERMEIKK